MLGIPGPSSSKTSLNAASGSILDRLEVNASTPAVVQGVPRKLARGSHDLGLVHEAHSHFYGSGAYVLTDTDDVV